MRGENPREPTLKNGTGLMFICSYLIISSGGKLILSQGDYCFQADFLEGRQWPYAQFFKVDRQTLWGSLPKNEEAKAINTFLLLSLS